MCYFNKRKQFAIIGANKIICSQNYIYILLMFQEYCNTKLMQLDHGNIHVGQYMTKMPPKELLEQKLSLAIANARELLEQRKEE